MLLNKRDELERAVLSYREKKAKLPENEYYRELEKLLLDLARVYETNSSLPTSGTKAN